MGWLRVCGGRRTWTRRGSCGGLAKEKQPGGEHRSRKARIRHPVINEKSIIYTSESLGMKLYAVLRGKL